MWHHACARTHVQGTCPQHKAWYHHQRPALTTFLVPHPLWNDFSQKRNQRASNPPARERAEMQLGFCWRLALPCCSCEILKMENTVSLPFCFWKCKNTLICLCCNLSHVFLMVNDLEKTKGKEEPQRRGMAEARRQSCWGNTTIRKHFLPA